MYDSTPTPTPPPKKEKNDIHIYNKSMYLTLTATMQTFAILPMYVNALDTEFWVHICASALLQLHLLPLLNTLIQWIGQRQLHDCKFWELVRFIFDVWRNYKSSLMSGTLNSTLVSTYVLRFMWSLCCRRIIELNYLVNWNHHQQSARVCIALFFSQCYYSCTVSVFPLSTMGSRIILRRAFSHS